MTLIIALIGCIGTIATWIVYFLDKRTNISFEPICYLQTRKGILIYGTFENNSNSSISITDLSLTVDGNKFHVIRIPTVVMTREINRNSQLISREETHNLPFPMNLSPCSGQSGYFLFPTEPQNQVVIGSTLNFEICTNRKKKISISVPRPQPLRQ